MTPDPGSPHSVAVARTAQNAAAAAEHRPDVRPIISFNQPTIAYTTAAPTVDIVGDMFPPCKFCDDMHRPHF